ncbi:hypothetical protein B0T22DRAFT_48292 [Podospora appendiculata]|uniref:BTB domain-containing protein n=1 Tax=Podospora appendiculata TaxID=314037 RepID=A0AAE0XHZ4_9PEZI|nr:hypothetical protein B0T22DRAFT_48292 [Podospora appendiculata]
MKFDPRKAVPNPLWGSEMVRVLVGEHQREFDLHKKLLCDASTFFRDNLEGTQTTPSLSSSSSSTARSSPSLSSSLPFSPPPPPPPPPKEEYEDHDEDDDDDDDTIMWLPTQSPDVFEIFVVWLYRPRAFQAFIDGAIQSVSPNAAFCRLPKLQNESCRRALRWNLVQLHLFAELTDLPVLQDIAMDALQDIYLRCDWDISPQFVAFLYESCDAEHAVRIRRWAVAMVAWTLNSGEKGLANATQFERLFAKFPSLYDDYRAHLDKMVGSKADVRIKNPQLRLPVNNLRNGERFFGFRQCTFHSHRALVGEGPCPHTLLQSPSSRSPRMRTKAVMEAAGSDEEEDEIITPVSVSDLNETSFLDLS